MGMLHDKEERIASARFDNKIRQKKVADARKLIYEKNYAVDSKRVEDLLKEESLVPTDVCLVYAVFIYVC
jgi:anti-sigma28 factor (negative regulator of flagellin synthesis)